MDYLDKQFNNTNNNNQMQFPTLFNPLSDEEFKKLFSNIPNPLPWINQPQSNNSINNIIDNPNLRKEKKILIHFHLPYNKIIEKTFNYGIRVNTMIMESLPSLKQYILPYEYGTGKFYFIYIDIIDSGKSKILDEFDNTRIEELFNYSIKPVKIIVDEEHIID